MVTPVAVETNSSPIGKIDKIRNDISETNDNTYDNTNDELLNLMTKMDNRINNIENPQSDDESKSLKNVSGVAGDLKNFMESAEVIKSLTSSPVTKKFEEASANVMAQALNNGMNNIFQPPQQKEEGFVSKLATTIGGQLATNLLNPEVIDTVLSKLTPNQQDRIIDRMVTGESPSSISEYSLSDLINANPDSDVDVMRYGVAKNIDDWESARQTLIEEQNAVRSGQDVGESYIENTQQIQPTQTSAEQPTNNIDARINKLESIIHSQNKALELMGQRFSEQAVINNKFTNTNENDTNDEIIENTIIDIDDENNIDNDNDINDEDDEIDIDDEIDEIIEIEMIPKSTKLNKNKFDTEKSNNGKSMDMIIRNKK